MNLLKEYPRFVTFLVLVITFIYCGYFTYNIGNVLSPSSIQKNTPGYGFGVHQSKIQDPSATGIIKEVTSGICRRIEHGIRQTSHLIGY
jgi:hypothetical protein